jgi:putative SOS response-associated peptidase YedK
MCGRYAGFLPPEMIARLFGTMNPLPNRRPTWNMAPPMETPVVRRHAGSGIWMHWRGASSPPSSKTSSRRGGRSMPGRKRGDVGDVP